MQTNRPTTEPEVDTTPTEWEKESVERNLETTSTILSCINLPSYMSQFFNRSRPKDSNPQNKSAEKKLTR
jgi:hypothetical protein